MFRGKLRCCALILGTVGIQASAASYQFVNIVDDAGPLDPISLAAINNSGMVAFKAYRDAGGEGVFIGSGGAVTTLYDTSGPFNEFGFPDINDSGTVSFWATLDAGGAAWFTGNGGPTTTIAPGTGRNVINNSGAVAFDTEGQGVFVGSGGPIITIADTSGPLRGNFVVTSINDGGTVGFFAWLDDFAGEGVFIGDGGPTATIALSGPGHPFDGVQDVQINNAGTIAFAAGLRSPSGTIPTIFVGSPGSLSTFVDGSGPFRGFEPFIGLNNHGQIAFEGLLDGGGEGIFTGPDPVADKVIQIGDLLFGSNVTSLSFQHGLNEQGDVVFYYELANGIEGIAVARPQQPLVGDDNGDGSVDAADYVVWRKKDGTPEGYDEWRANFGQTAAIGSGATAGLPGSADKAVPEPDVATFLMLAGLSILVRRRRLCLSHDSLTALPS